METEPTPGQNIGRNVRALRDWRLMSQRELARRSGLAQITIASLEAGRSVRPRRPTVEKLAEGLGVPAEELIHGDFTRGGVLRPKVEDPLPDAPRRREEHPFAVVPRVSPEGISYRVLWNVPPEEREGRRADVERLTGGLPYTEEDMTPEAAAALIGVG